MSVAYNTQRLLIADMHLCTIMSNIPIIDAYPLFIVNKFSQHLLVLQDFTIYIFLFK